MCFVPVFECYSNRHSWQWKNQPAALFSAELNTFHSLAIPKLWLYSKDTETGLENTKRDVASVIIAYIDCEWCTCPHMQFSLSHRDTKSLSLTFSPEAAAYQCNSLWRFLRLDAFAVPFLDNVGSFRHTSDLSSLRLCSCSPTKRLSKRSDLRRSHCDKIWWQENFLELKVKLTHHSTNMVLER